MAAMRSVSFTRNSSALRMMVVPLARAPGHRENRQFVDQLRDLLALNDRPFERAPVISTIPRGSI